MAVACLADSSQSSYLFEMASNLTEFSRSPSRSQSGADALQDEEVAGVDENCDGSSEEVPSVGPDSWLEDEDASMPSFASNRDKLQHHRMQVAGHVTIPDSWPGDEHLLDWIESEPVEEALRPLGLVMARAALIGEHSDGKSNMYRRNT